MKKIAAFIAMMLFTAISYSREIPLDKAYELAETFFGINAETKDGGYYLKLLWDGKGLSTKTNVENPAFYVFGKTSGKGFVIISGDDALRPVLAWSDDTEFRVDDIPENSLWWYESVSAQVAQLRKSSAAPYVCKSLEDNTEFLIPTAAWDQKQPYNDECPLSNTGVRTVTGCVATAMAIVMHQRQWPDAGVGTVPEYETSGGIKVSERVLGKYDWANLPFTDAKSSRWTTTQESDIARIMADCGAAVKANYRYPETSANEARAVNVFIDHMKYDKSVHMDWRGYYSDKEWSDLLKSELHSNGSIFYTANNDKGGHAFVIDGYSTAGLFHVNWGWGGSYNAYYSLDNMNSDMSSPYNYSHDMIAGMKPDEGGKFTEKILLYTTSIMQGLTVISRNPENDIPINISVGGFWNKGQESYTGKFRVGVFDREMNLIKELWITEIENLSPSAYIHYDDIQIDVDDVDFGYRLAAQFYNNNTGEWEKVRASYEYNGISDILLADEYSIEDSTIFAYNEADDMIIISTKEGVTVSCNFSGKDIPLKNISPTEYHIDASSLKDGVHVLHLEKDKEMVEVEFVTGG